MELDDLSEQAILDLTCQMTIAATAHKTVSTKAKHVI